MYRPVVRLAAFALAACGGTAVAAPASGYSWSVFTGKYTASGLPDEILALQPIEFEDAWITVFNLGRVLAEPAADRRWDAELQFGIHHSGVQDHHELNLAVIHRWSDWPWDGLLRTSLAMGAGLSLASEVPHLEATGKPGADAQRLLLYGVFEFEVAPHWARDWSIYARIHHRSGLFGAFNGIHGGSDHVGIGFRWNFGD